MVHENDVATSMRQWSGWLNIAVLAEGILVILGWQFNIEFLKHPLHGLVAMNPATAVGLILFSVSLIFYNKNMYTVAYAIAVFIVMAAVIKLITLAAGLQGYIDTFLFSEKVKSDIVGDISNSMAPNTAAGFVQAGLALMFLHLQRKDKINITQWLATLLLIMAFVSLTGYLYKARILYGLQSYIPMAVHTSLGFLMLSLALLFHSPDTGIMKIISSPYSGSRMARILLPVAIIVPVLLSALFERSHLFSPEKGLMLHETSLMFIFISTILIISKRLNRESIQTEKAKAELHTLNNDLEDKVLQRTADLEKSLKKVSDYKYALNQSSTVEMTDKEGRITFANQNFLRLSKYSIDELMGNNHRMMNSGYHPISHFTDLWKTIQSGKIWRSELKNKAGDGSFFWTNTVIIPILDEQEQPYKYMIFREDITKRKEAEFELAKTITEMEERIEKRTEELSTNNRVLRDEVIERITVSHKLEEKSKEITDGINYARRIQKAIIHKPFETANRFNGRFNLLIPKDIICGDFFWHYDVHDMHFIAAVDCTGHGVPGALMSMIGHQFLNQVMVEHKCYEPSEILTLLDHKLVDALHQYSEDMVRDGMDIALCRIDKKEKQILFSGACRPLFYFNGTQLEEIPGSKNAIGGYHNIGIEKTFNQQSIRYKEGDCIYLTSDGYYSQFNHATDKKMMKRRLFNILESIATKDAEEQHLILKRYFNEWKGDAEQVDDVLVVGVKF